VRVAVDAMGGDNAPAVEVEGAVAAARDGAGAIEVVLVGRQAAIEAELAKHGAVGLPLSVVDAPDTIAMDESPAAAVRRKRRASMVVAAELHKSGEVDGVVSAGNTGAFVAATLLALGKLPGVRRPAIASLFPTVKDPVLVLDVGASLDSRPSDLLDFALMGDTFARHVLDRERPRVGLMNIGEESTKGGEVILEAHRLLSASPLHFVGNIQGRGLLRGEADVVVCDGFVGNIMLKLTEGVIDLLAGVLSGDLRTGVLQTLAKKLDYAEYGGAPLLGVNGVVIIAHGSSSPKAIKNAVNVAARFVDIDLDGKIVDSLRKVATGDAR
jgi:glycerol-3-phosphate acyltransferase PlsX